MKLYFSPGACSLAPHIVLREAALPFDLVKVDTKAHRTADGTDYYTINPKGAVPVLELDDGERLTEGPIIAQYIADRARNENLAPAAGSLARYRVQEWQNYVTSELHKSFSPLFGAPALDDGAKEAFKEALRKKYRWVDSQLQGKAFLTGSTFTVADAYLFAVTSWAKPVKLELSDLDNVQGFLRRVAERPSVQEALRAEGLR